MAPSFSPDLRVAYERAEYCIYIHGSELKLYVNQASQTLDQLLLEYAVSSAAFITAANPQSVACSDTENAQRHAQLKADIERAGFACLEGEGRDPLGLWPSEHSLLIFGITLDDATELARRHEQNAFVFLGVAAPALLIEVAGV